ncbi:hypothetical protein PLESTB_001957400 [Pleodorina starrii]|uniref:J domain-containing protein n=1 Tax=Pleodorina starrii TaxID=330485 RepID=A0A9W6C2Y3_9CHLO|nr:hypothetical protein PLESTM_000934900 [Pleodorina starrii]GLC62903.1 hypothetical protein PLESTB_001957400 [Pleodorina starrii]GLC77193.1 hypothetical protein PLESTF_001896600 [Pleodorina starrii]
MFRCSHNSHCARSAQYATDARSCQKLKFCSRSPRPANVVCSAVTASVKTHYDILGVDDCASARDIKEAFRRLVLVWHPDRCEHPGATDKFLELKAAYDTLVDMAARTEYDLQLKKAGQPPPPPTTVRYDWAKYRSTNMRRPRRSRTFTRFSRPAAVPPQPTARAPYGDDFDALFPSRGAGGVSGHTAADASRAASTSGQAASAQQAYAAATSSASTSPASHSQSNPSSSSSSGSSASNSVGGSSVINHTSYAYQRAGRVTSASLQSTNRTRSCTGSRLRYSQTGSFPTDGPSRAPPPPPDQQWRSTSRTGGEGSASSAGTSYAAATAAVCAAAYAAGRREGASSSSGAAAAWDAWIAGGGSSSESGIASVAEVGSPLEPPDQVPAWRLPTSPEAGGDDQAPKQHAHVPVERREAPPVRARAAPTAQSCHRGHTWNPWPLMWEVLECIVPLRM